jgi:hypothetical protein
MTLRDHQTLIPNRRDFLRRSALGLGWGGALLTPGLFTPEQVLADTSHYRNEPIGIENANELLMDGYHRGWVLFAGRVFYDFQLYVDPTFTDAQKRILREAMDFHFKTRTVHLHSLAEQAMQAAQWDLPGGVRLKKDHRPSKQQIAKGLSATQWQWYNALYGQIIPYPVVAADDPVAKRRALDDEGKPVTLNGQPVYVGLRPMLGWVDRPDNKKTRLHISRMWDEPRIWGRGWVGSVNRKDPTYVFSIALNTDYLGRAGSTDPRTWAGVIVHECLHNLGYTHPEDASDREYDHYFINVFQDQYVLNGAPGAGDGGKADALPRRGPRLVGCCRKPRKKR